MKKNGTKAWMMTYTGKHVFPLNVRALDIDIADIAHSLALQCRYNGMVSDFYSVAEHGLLIAEALKRDGHSPEIQFAGLNHDDPEAYLSDMIRPIKNALGPAYAPFRSANDRIAGLIAKKYGIINPLPDAVHEYDARIINDEKAVLFGAGKPWNHGGKALDVDIQCYEPKTAERLFRFRFWKLFAQIHGNRRV